MFLLIEIFNFIDYKVHRRAVIYSNDFVLTELEPENGHPKYQVYIGGELYLSSRKPIITSDLNLVNNYL